MDHLTSALTDHAGTAKGAAGVGLAAILSYVSTGLTVVVLLLTAYNLILEIKKKRKEG